MNNIFITMWLTRTTSNSITAKMLLVAIVFLCTVFHVHAKSPGQDAVDIGTQFYKDGKYTQARDAFQRATELDPGLIRAWENLGWSYFQIGNMQDALRIWEMVLKIEPDNIALINASAKAQLENGDMDTAMSLYKKSLALQNSQPTVHMQLGDLYARQGDIAKAITQYSLTSKQELVSESAALRLSNLLENEQRETDAVAALEKIQQQQALSPLVEKNLARLYAKRAKQLFKQKKYSEAETLYRKAAKMDTEQERYLIELGHTLRKQQKNHEAISHWQTALRQNALHTDLYRHIGDAFFESGDKNNAQQWYEKSMESGKDNPGVLLRLADTALENHKPDEAKEWLNRLLSQKKLKSSWWQRVINTYQKHEQFDEGISLIEAIFETNKNKTVQQALSRMHGARASHRLAKGDLGGASDDFIKALQYDANNLAALRDLGWTYWRLEMWPQVEQHWTLLLKKAPEKQLVHNLLSQYYLRTHQPQETIEHSHKSLAYDSTQLDQKLRLAKAMYMANRFNETKILVAQLAREHPDNLAIQYFHGDQLNKFQEYALAKTQWQRVVELDPDSVRAYYNFVKATYESGEYEDAVNAAKRYVHTREKHPLMIKIIANDAILRKDLKEAIKWNTLLVELEPEKLERWVDLSKILFAAKQYDQGLDVLNRALKVHPDNIEILLTRADHLRALGEYSPAIKQYNLIAYRNPGNRRAFAGLYYTLMEDRQYDKALNLLKQNRPGFFTQYELAMETARILTVQTDSSEAVNLFDKVIPSDYKTQIIPILVYHGLSTHERSNHLYVDYYENQMAAIAREGFTPLTLSDFHAMRTGQIPFPTKPILITFDDARRDSFEHADPILKLYNLKSTMFVPTSRILDGHPFYADWSALRRYAASGRWDMQSHGHLAHDPLPIDADGNTGGFLVNRAWIGEQARLESTPEFIARIKGDHQQSIDLLNREIQGLNIVAFAYPFSEAGQESIGNEPLAYDINEDAVREFYKYSFVQDTSGFNIVQIGDTSSLLLRRFSVPRDWNGKQLIAHLSKNNPQTAARMAKGQHLYWQGKPAKAHEVFLDLDLEEPDVANQSKFYLAATANSLGWSRQAAYYIDSYERTNLQLSPQEIALKRAIMWNNNPRFNVESGSQQDSDQRRQRWQQASFVYPWSSPIDIWFNAGQKSLAEDNQPDIYISQISFGIKRQHSDTVASQAEIRARTFNINVGEDADNNIPDSINTWIGTTYQTDTFKFNLNWAEEDVDTVSAHLANVLISSVSTRFTLWPRGSWSAMFHARGSHYSDENERLDGRATLFYQMQQSGSHWRFGAETSYSDTTQDSPLYYSPLNLRANRFVLQYSHRGNTRFPFHIALGGGKTWDDLHEARIIGDAEIEATQLWNAYIKTTLTAGYYEAPGYHSAGVEFSLQFHF